MPFQHKQIISAQASSAILHMKYIYTIQDESFVYSSEIFFILIDIVNLH